MVFLRGAISAFVLLCALVAHSNAVPFDFTVPPVDDVEDFHGDANNPQLVIFMAGNQFMVMDDLLAAFRREHPKITRVFYETLPPGIVARQIYAGSIKVGNLVVSDFPDVFLSGRGRMSKMVDEGFVAPPVSYASNQLAIMVRRGNPLGIKSLKDLGKAAIRVAMPNPQWEGIGKQIVAAYKLAGGSRLVTTIMHTKVRSGTTLLTRIHHRETPYFILTKKADAGPVWISEALYQHRLGTPIDTVTIPSSKNITATYQAAILRKALHKTAAREFLVFLRGKTAQAIYRSYGFTPASDNHTVKEYP